MTLKACILAEQSAPRYTSYPTAPHFGPAIGASTYADWLAALDPRASLSLYLHVPYCARLCLYCGCHTKIVQRRAPVDAYAELLAQEIDLVAARTKRQRVSSIHWGGGTPSMLGPERLIALHERIARRFDCTRVTEHAIEIDPRQATPRSRRRWPRSASTARASACRNCHRMCSARSAGCSRSRRSRLRPRCCARPASPISTST